VIKKGVKGRLKRREKSLQGHKGISTRKERKKAKEKRFQTGDEDVAGGEAKQRIG